MAFKEVLEAVRNAGVLGAAVVSRDGTVLGADLPDSVQRETFSIMCATIHGAGMTVSSQLQRTNPKRIVLESPEGRIVILEAGRRALLALVLAQDTDVEQVAQDSQSAIERIARETG